MVIKEVLTRTEVDRLEREGKITADDAADERLPGPFSLVSFCEHLIKDKTWGDDHVLSYYQL